MDVEKVIFGIFADAAPYSRVVRDAENEMVGFARAATGMGHEITVPIVAATTAVVSLAAGIAGAGAVAIKAASDFERTSISLEVMTGSAAQASKMMDELAQFSVRTPFSFEEIHAGARQLKAFGFETDQLIPTLSNLGNVVAGTGADFTRLIHAYGQVSAAGRLMGPQLREFVNAGVPMLEYLSRILDKPKQSIRGLIEEGKIGFPEVIRAFNLMNQEGGLYFGMTDRLLHTTAGAWSAYVKTIEIGLRNIGLSFIKTFGTTSIIKSWTDNIQGMVENTAGFDAFFEKVKDGVNHIWEMTKAIREWYERNQELLIVIGQIALGLTAVWIAMGLIRLAFSTALVPLLGMVAGWRALLVAVSFLYNFEGILEIQTWPQFFETASDAIQSFVGNAQQIKLVTGIVIAATVAFGILRFGIIATTVALTALRFVFGQFMALRAFIFGIPAQFVALGSAIMAVLSPLGVLVALLATLTFAGLMSGDFEKQGQELIKMVDDLARVFGKTWGGIQEALSNNDIKGAAEIAFKGIEVAFKRVVAALKIEWYEFVQGMISGIGPGMQGIWSSFRLQMKYITGGTDEAGFERELKAIRDRDKNIKATPVGQEYIDAANAGWKKSEVELDTLLRGKSAAHELARNSQFAPDLSAISRMSMEDILPGFSNQNVLQEHMQAAGAVGGFGGLPHLALQEDRASMMDKKMGDLIRAIDASRLAYTKGDPNADNLAKAARDMATGMGLIKEGNVVTPGGAVVREQPRVPFSISSDALKFREDIVREMAKEGKAGIGAGTGIYSTFLKDLNVIDQLVNGPLAKYGAGVPQAAGGLIGGLPVPFFQRAISPEEEEFATFQRYGILHRAVSKTADNFPRAMLQGSSEAQDVINRANTHQTSVLEDVRASLISAEQIEKQQLEYVKAINEAIKTLKAEGLNVDKIIKVGDSGK